MASRRSRRIRKRSKSRRSRRKSTRTVKSRRTYRRRGRPYRRNYYDYYHPWDKSTYVADKSYSPYYDYDNEKSYNVRGKATPARYDWTGTKHHIPIDFDTYEP